MVEVVEVVAVVEDVEDVAFVIGILQAKEAAADCCWSHLKIEYY